MSYLLPSGTTINKSMAVPANSRVTIDVETEDPGARAKFRGDTL